MYPRRVLTQIEDQQRAGLWEGRNLEYVALLGANWRRNTGGDVVALGDFTGKERGNAKGAIGSHRP